ncbi:MAG: DUF2066 domain-containing protein, partial [Shewanella sp.]
MRKLFILFMVLNTYLWSNFANAVVVQQLNQAVVPVTDRSADARKVALADALKQVIIKNTGNPNALTNPLVQAQINDPDAILRQFGYLQIEGQLAVTASFDERRLISLLREANVPIWGKQRPLILMWLANDDQQATQEPRQLVGDESSLTIRKDFKQQGQDAGVPLLFPVLDLDDMMLVSVTDVAGGLTGNIAQASLRYGADYFAITSVLADATGWTYRLALYKQASADETQGAIVPLLSDSGSAVTELEASQAIISKISQFLVQRYAVADNGEGTRLQLQVGGLSNLEDMHKLQTYLQQLSVVKQITLSELKPSAAIYQISLFSNEQDFQRLLALEASLSPVSPFKTTNSPASVNAQVDM